VNYQEHLLLVMAEECAEVAQRVSKAIRFGIDEIQPGQSLTNAERIMQEMDDLEAVRLMLTARALLPGHTARNIQAKIEKLAVFMKYAEQCGTLTVEPEREAQQKEAT
jgi:hypothetical protein